MVRQASSTKEKSHGWQMALQIMDPADLVSFNSSISACGSLESLAPLAQALASR